ncbi:tetratricopeptide repeat protein [Streptomyces hydrogenans]|uniref:tetratricopeptide repeat protein n=1 Tax=Streptomyces hydrogenans TaxID=1873719 RepID=UPI00367EE4E7
MNEEQALSGKAALAELRRRLGDGLAGRRWTKTQLARRAELGRTTVSEAFSEDGLPSEQTVAALADALRLPREELLELRRAATKAPSEPGGLDGQVVEDALRLGRPIGEWDPHALEVHPAGPVTATGADAGRSAGRVLSGYVRREHDQVLAEAVLESVSGHSRIVVLVGSSSTGKTRACWEAVQPLAEKGWRLWHPFDPTRAEAALEDLHRVGPCTVVWLNEAQHYLGDREHGERIAAAFQDLITSPEHGPVLVLGTLWPEYAQQYRAVPAPGKPDPHSRVRELLAANTLTVPEFFDAPALAAATKLAEDGDALLAGSLTRTDSSGRVTQDLAGAPELLDRLHDATAPARALLEAAMDARRLSVGLHLPQAFLTDAAIDYLTDLEHDQLTDNWAALAYAELARPVHGKQAPLRPANPRPVRRPTPPTTPVPPSPSPSGPVVRLADYLEQHGRAARRPLCPPASFWHAALTHLPHPDDLNSLAQAAHDRHRLEWSHALRHRAAEHSSPPALAFVGRMREEAGDLLGAEAAYREATDHGHTEALFFLGGMRERAGNLVGAEAAYREAADHGHRDSMLSLGLMRKGAGNLVGAEAAYREAADHGHTFGLLFLGRMREEVGDLVGAQAAYREATDRGDHNGMLQLGKMLEEAGDLVGAEAAYREAADRSNPSALVRLGGMWERAGDLVGAEAAYREAADHDFTGLLSLGSMREKAGDLVGAEAAYREAVDHDGAIGLLSLGSMRAGAGDLVGAEAAFREAVDRGSDIGLFYLGSIREMSGDRAGAEAVDREAVDRGDAGFMSDRVRKRWPFGLDPDGTPTSPWDRFW